MCKYEEQHPRGKFAICLARQGRRCMVLNKKACEENYARRLSRCAEITTIYNPLTRRFERRLEGVIAGW
ncbi:hypothetical protein [Candidatus Pyrohabitans sp.]